MSFCATPNNLECRVQSSECYEFRILVGELIRNHFAFAIWCAYYLPLFDVCSRWFCRCLYRKMQRQRAPRGVQHNNHSEQEKTHAWMLHKVDERTKFPTSFYIYICNHRRWRYTYDRMLYCFVITSIDRSILTEKHTER